MPIRERFPLVSAVFVTGSTQGIGLETATTLVAAGHRVVLHARDEARAADARAAVPGHSGVVVGDLASLAQTRELAGQAERQGPFDAVIHNAGVGGGVAERTVTVDGLERIFQINVVAPYLLTALMSPPARLIYLTSGLEASGRADWDDLQFERRRWDGMQAYSDSKLYDVMLAFAVGRRRPGTIVNAVDPGWVKTRMGGPAATDELPQGADTQVWLATGADADALRTGRFLKHRRTLVPNPAASDEKQQDTLLARLAEITGVDLAA
jgi:NAD(P)-dependent dehydrogenase (short-subunit alcohol dehydrogenase family)